MQHKIEKYKLRLIAEPINSPKFSLYLNKLNYWYNQIGGDCPKITEVDSKKPNGNEINEIIKIINQLIAYKHKIGNKPKDLPENQTKIKEWYNKINKEYQDIILPKIMPIIKNKVGPETIFNYNNGYTFVSIIRHVLDYVYENTKANKKQPAPNHFCSNSSIISDLYDVLKSFVTSQQITSFPEDLTKFKNEIDNEADRKYPKCA